MTPGGGQPYNPCGFVTDIYREQFFVKYTYFATLILRKVKEIGLNPTTRFEDLDLNCVIGWFKKFRILNRLLAEETPAE